MDWATPGYWIFTATGALVEARVALCTWERKSCLLVCASVVDHNVSQHFEAHIMKAAYGPAKIQIVTSWYDAFCNQ